MEENGCIIVGEAPDPINFTINRNEKKDIDWMYKQLKNRMVIADPDNKKCFNCNEDPKYQLKFGKGVSMIKIKLCRDCILELKNMLDKEFDMTWWQKFKNKFNEEKK